MIQLFQKAQWGGLRYIYSRIMDPKFRGGGGGGGGQEKKLYGPHRLILQSLKETAFKINIGLKMKRYERSSSGIIKKGRRASTALCG